MRQGAIGSLGMSALQAYHVSVTVWQPIMEQPPVTPRSFRAAPVLRSLAAIVVGLAVITMVTEGIEIALVTLVHGERTTDPEVYFGVRNQGWFLAVKLAYNSTAAALGGFLAAWVAGRAERRHGVGLAAVQTAAFGMALATPDMRQWTPDWMWAALIVVSIGGIMLGATMRARAHDRSRPDGA